MNKLIACIAILSITICSCKRANVTEVHPMSSNYSDTSKVLLMEDKYPCMKLVTDNVTHIQAKGKDETQTYGIIQNGEPLNLKHSYLPLETTDDCLIGHVDKMLSDDTSIFILDADNGSALCFSQKDGSFICKYGTRGRGPGEYVSVNDMIIDIHRKEVCLLDYSQYKLMYFSYDGEFLREEPQFYGFGEMEFCGKNIVLCTRYSENIMVPAINNSSVVLAERDQTPLFRGFPFPEHYRDNFNQAILKNFITCKDDVYFCHEMSDTIWQIKENGVCEAKYVFKFTGRDNLFDERDFQEINNTTFKAKTENNAYFAGLTRITEDFIVTDIINGQRMVYCISTGHHYYGLSNHYFFASPTTFHGDFTLNGTSFVDMLQPFNVLQTHNMFKGMYNERQYENYWNNLLTEEERQLLQKMTPEDNPILVIIDIEPF